MQVAEREKKLAGDKSYVKRSEINDYERERYLERCTKRKRLSSEEVKPVAEELESPTKVCIYCRWYR